MKELFSAGTVNNLQVSATGGSEGLQYLISGGFINQDGIVVGSNDGYKRVNFRTNLSGHDMPRMLDRLAEGNEQRAKALAVLMLTAKGIPFVYYGEEIGMHNIISNNFDEMRDVQGKVNYHLALEKGKSKEEALKIGNEHNRDKSRSPMQWNYKNNAGFTASVIFPFLVTLKSRVFC